MRLCSIELVMPGIEAAAAFMTGIWGMAPAQDAVLAGTRYLRESGPMPNLVALQEGREPLAGIHVVNPSRS